MLTWSMLCFPLLGAVAGILAGLLGIGDGLVLATALVWLLPLYGVPQDAAMHTALARAGEHHPDRSVVGARIICGAACCGGPAHRWCPA